MRKSLPRIAALMLLASTFCLAAETAPPPTDLDVLTRALARPLAALQGRKARFTVTLEGRYKSGDSEEAAKVTITRAGNGAFGLALASKPFTLSLVRDAEATRLLVPTKKVAVVGKGAVPEKSDLEPGTLFTRVVAVLPMEAQAILGLLSTAEPGVVALLLQQFAQLGRGEDAKDGAAVFVSKKPMGKGTLAVELSPDGASLRTVRWRDGKIEVAVSVTIADEASLPAATTDGLKVLDVPRAELERMLGRALARAVDVLRYNDTGELPADADRTAGRGRLIVKDGARLCTLQGTPYEIGFQHGRLLRGEMRRLMDSVLCAVGLAYTVEKGEWFPDVMRGAFKRLEPHIPKEYLEELKGLSDGAGVPYETACLGNVFPALFHCSGFALVGKATKGGKLLHGRVLDYMTEVGLQRDAVVFVVKKDGAIPFANVSYAGFIGCVSGMNAEQVALGEMGGGGEGLWDGTPMPILMRMGCERAKTLEDACRIFREAKRTCEYYYVFSDGKIPSAVGVGATPEKIEFIKLGQAHPLLPTPVEDCVLLSAGSRYGHLVRKVKEQYGQFDVAAACDLMKRPVAMRSNLHDVLFVPQDLALYVANARGSKAACDQPYKRYHLPAILAQMARPPETK